MPAFEAASADDPGEAASLPDGPPAVAVLFSGAVEPAGVPSGHLASILCRYSAICALDIGVFCILSNDIFVTSLASQNIYRIVKLIIAKKLVFLKAVWYAVKAVKLTVIMQRWKT